MSIPTAPSPPRYWRGIPQHYRLEAVKAESGEVMFPPRAVASDGSHSSELYALPHEGSLIAFTILHEAIPGFAVDPPFAVGIVELSDGTRLSAQITGVNLDQISIGMPLRYAFRKLQEDGVAGTIIYGYKFVPNAESAED